MTPRTRGAGAVPALIAAVLLGPLALATPAHADSGQAYVEGRVTDGAGHHTVLAASKRITPPRIGHVVKAPALAVPASALDAAWTGPITPPTPTSPAPGAQPAILGTASAAAGGPIGRFVAGEVVPGGSLPSIRRWWNQYAGYRSTPDQSTYHLAVDADGYEPFDVQVPLSDAGPVTRDVALTAEPIVTGRLVVPHPQRGWWADVNISSASGQHVAKVGADAKGRFRAVLDDRLGAGPYAISVKVVYLHPRSRMVWRSSTGTTFAPGTTTNVGKLRVHKP